MQRYLVSKMGYITVIRDLESGAVLYIGLGKVPDALRKFRNPRHSTARITDVSI